MQGRRGLSAKSVKQFSRALSLNKQESEFFAALVFFNQATDPEEKTKFYDQMTKCRRYREINYIDKDIFEYYSKWYHVTIREMVQLPGFQENPEWIAARVFPSISPDQARQAINLLIKLNFLKRDGKGKLVQSDPIVSTQAEVRSLAVTNFHRQMLKLAEQSLTLVTSDQRDVTSVTIGLTKDQLPEVKKMIEMFRLDLITSVVADDENPQAIYQLNIQLFPTTRDRGKPC